MTIAVYSTPAIIVGAGINGLGVLRSLAHAGVPVVVVDSSPDAPAMRSRYGRKHVFREEGPDSIVGVLESLAAECPQERPVVVFTQEETVAVAARHYERLANCCRLTMSAPATIVPLLHKDGVRAVAEAAGVRTPRTLHIRDIGQIQAIDELKLPIVIKPALRHEGYSSAFKKAYRIDDRAQARELLRDILPVLPDVVVQEWIEGTDSDLYFCLQYLPPSGEPPVSFVGRKIRSWPPQVGGTASCIAAPEASELADMTWAFFQHAQVTGLASMEYKREQETGDYVVVEPTVGRTDFQEEVATLNGVNLPLAAYCGALGLAMPQRNSQIPPTIWRERNADIRSANHAEASTPRLPAHACVVDALWRLRDPGPVLWSVAQRLRRRMIRVINRQKNQNKVGK